MGSASEFLRMSQHERSLTAAHRPIRPRLGHADTLLEQVLFDEWRQRTSVLAGELPGNRYLSGMRSREIGGARGGQLLFDDTPGQIAVQLTSEHADAELNLAECLRHWHDGSNVAPAGVVLTSEDAIALGAQTKIDIVSCGDAQVGARRSPFLRASRALSLFAYELGMKLIAARGSLAATELKTDERVVVVDRQTNLPARGQRYIASHEDGTRIEGVTDAKGSTSILRSYAMGAVQIAVPPDRATIGSIVGSSSVCPASGWWRCEDRQGLDGARWFSVGTLLPAATVVASARGRAAGPDQYVHRRSASA